MDIDGFITSEIDRRAQLLTDDNSDMSKAPLIYTKTAMLIGVSVASMVEQINLYADTYGLTFEEALKHLKITKPELFK